MKDFGMRKELNSSYDEALASVPEALKAEGFGVLTEIDVAATLKKKLDVDFRRYKILGACNPPFAHKALQADLRIGLMMPCNVVVYEGDNNKAVVLAVDPMQTIGRAEGAPPEMKKLAEEVQQRLVRAVEKMK